jgi:spore maturation protein CgeB
VNPNFCLKNLRCSLKKLFKIDFLMPRYSQYSVLHHFLEKLYEAFKRANHLCRLLKEEDQTIVPQNDPPDFTICFNGALINEKNEFVCDILKIPHVSLLVDPPFRYLNLIKSPYMIISCDDRSGCKFLEDLNFHRSFFLPHAVERELAPIPLKERVFDVVMLATFIDYKKNILNWPKLFPTEICKIMEEAAEITFESSISFIQAFENLYEKLLKNSPKDKFNDLSIKHVLSQLEFYIKGKDRILLAESLKDIPLHIFGTTKDLINWKTYFGIKHPNIHVHGGITYDSALSVMQQSKIVLNPSLKNREGAHERFFSGVACGSLVITNESLFLSEQFQENEEIIFYHHQNLEEMNSKILSFLSHEDQRTAIVEKGRQKVLAYHTWDNRVAELMQYVPHFLEKMGNNEIPL